MFFCDIIDLLFSLQFSYLGAWVQTENVPAKFEIWIVFDLFTKSTYFLMLISSKPDLTSLWQWNFYMPLHLLIVADQVSRIEAKMLTSLS